MTQTALTAKISAASIARLTPNWYNMTDLSQFKSDILAFAAITPEHVYVRNILSVWYSAPESARHEGLAWYETARAVAADLATRYGVSTAQAAGCIAALSPQLRWHHNIRAAELLLAAHATDSDIMTCGLRCAATGETRAKCARILAGDAPESVLGTEKTSSFFRCIMAPDLAYDVCIDGHACNIAENGTHRVAITAASVPAKKYRTMQAAYMLAADLAGVTPAQLQAVTWVAYRGDVK